MSVSKKDVEYVAELARLCFSEEEKDSLIGDLNSVLGYMEKLKELDTDNVDIIVNPYYIENKFREDEIQPSMELISVLKNAPDKLEEYVVYFIIYPNYDILYSSSLDCSSRLTSSSDLENDRAKLNTKIATAADAALIHVIAIMDHPPTTIPPMPAPKANPSCTKVLFRLSTIPEASGARDTRLKF